MKIKSGFYRNVAAAASLVCASIALASCSGGGSGSGSTPSSGGESQASREFPDNFTATIEENVSLSNLSLGSFEFTAPDNELPSNLNLTGPDAGLFRINFDISAPNGNGVRTILVTLDPSPNGEFPLVFNFENPEDENKDNIYEFQVTGTYKGETLRANVRLTVEDVIDAAETTAGQMYTSKKLFYTMASSISLPDITGDGLPEISVPLNSWSSDDDALLITSEAYSRARSGNLDLDTASTGVIRLFKKPGSAAVGAGYITAAENDSGFDILFTQPSDQRLILVQTGNGVDIEDLYGDFDPDLLSDKIVYTLAGKEISGRIVGDLNDDGVNDLVILEDDNRMGIMFGESLSQNPSRNRTVSLDIVLRDYNVFGSGLPQYPPETLRVQTLPDLDGDAVADILVFGPDRVTFYSGKNLKTPGSLVQSGIYYVASHSQPMNAVVLDDYNNDGTPTIALGSYFINDVNLAAARLGPTDARNRYFTKIGDVDGDGLQDLLVTEETYGTAQLLLGKLIAKVVKYRVNPSRSASGDSYLPDPGDIPEFAIDLRGPDRYGSFADSNPYYIESEGMLILPLSYNGTVDDSDSSYLVVDRDKIAQAFADDLPGIDIFIPERD
tara:strand:- start:26207 stop:28042 length:1836 start_codon:yes stop_codon:yes gene_type:complete